MPPSSAAMMQFSEEIIKQLTPEEIDEFREAFMMFDKVTEPESRPQVLL